MPSHSATYERPVRATLHVHLDNGETWEATPDDLARFQLGQTYVASTAFAEALSDVLHSHGLLSDRKEATDAALNPVRYLAEVSINYPHLLDHPDHDGWSVIADMERVLRAAGFAHRTPDGVEHDHTHDPNKPLVRITDETHDLIAPILVRVIHGNRVHNDAQACHSASCPGPDADDAHLGGVYATSIIHTLIAANDPQD